MSHPLYNGSFPSHPCMNDPNGIFIIFVQILLVSYSLWNSPILISFLDLVIVHMFLLAFMLHSFSSYLVSYISDLISLHTF